MRNTTIILIFTLSFSLVGCSSEAPQTPPTPETPETPAPVVGSSEESISTGTTEHSKTITVAGNIFRIMIRGLIAPNAVLDVSIIQSSGTPATTIRVWVGDESGVGSMKTKVHSHGARSHAQAQAPAKLPANSALWIEVQNADGTSGSEPIQLD